MSERKTTDGEFSWEDKWKTASSHDLEFKLSSAAAEWDNLETNFGESASLLNALNQCERQANKDSANGYPGLDGSSKISGSQQTYGSSSDTACEGDDSRLSDSRTPTTHASSHSDGGGDEVTVENLATAGTSGQVPVSQGDGSLAMGHIVRPAVNLAGTTPAASDVSGWNDGDVGKGIGTDTSYWWMWRVNSTTVVSVSMT